ncbi:MAG: hypothetical protein COV67_12985, partial [Nitrospinae bacterium CG11_big_fil_rev_8_21_14_0_20_56_8]
ENIKKELEELNQKKPTDKVREQIAELQKHLDSMNSDFELIATGMSREDIRLREDFKLDWFKEVEELVLPFISTLRNLTERPRKIDKLEKQIGLLEKRIQINEFASNNINRWIQIEKEKEETPEVFRKQYMEWLEGLKLKYDPDIPAIRLQEARDSLKKELSLSSDSLLESSSQAIRDFFKNRGRNFLTVLVTVGILWWIFARLRRWIARNRKLIPVSPITKKFLLAFYNILAVAVCLAASLVGFYIFNDWLLMSLVIIGSLVFVWSSRQWIPRFFQELRLILNLGTVCEKERIIWKGVPWLVQEIGLYATLVNPFLESGVVRMPVGELIGQHSRPVVDNEPWFPTQVGDWVMLADGTYGKVEHQTMEQVTLRLKGNTLKYHAAADFLAASPRNISKGFRYTLEFGLDYGIQNRICDEILVMFDKGLRRILANYLREADPDIAYLEVMFNSAGASSLNLMITIDMKGRCADRYYPIQREIQTALVRICNENGLVIPFAQLTLSLSDKLMEVAKGTRL